MPKKTIKKDTVAGTNIDVHIGLNATIREHLTIGDFPRLG
jgi:hypothetical protein